MYHNCDKIVVRYMFLLKCILHDLYMLTTCTKLNKNHFNKPDIFVKFLYQTF